MTAKDLRSLLYDAPDNSEVVILNENAPIKGAVPVYQTFTLKVDAGSKVVLMYQSSYNPGAKTGMKLSGRFVPGQHMFEKSLPDTKEDLRKITKSEVERLFRALF